MDIDADESEYTYDPTIAQPVRGGRDLQGLSTQDRLNFPTSYTTTQYQANANVLSAPLVPLPITRQAPARARRNYAYIHGDTVQEVDVCGQYRRNGNNVNQCTHGTECKFLHVPVGVKLDNNNLRGQMGTWIREVTRYNQVQVQVREALSAMRNKRRRPY